MRFVTEITIVVISIIARVIEITTPETDGRNFFTARPKLFVSKRLDGPRRIGVGTDQPIFSTAAQEKDANSIAFAHIRPLRHSIVWDTGNQQFIYKHDSECYKNIALSLTCARPKHES